MGKSGTHTVCVCSFHQNCKLMLEAIDIDSVTSESEKPIGNYKDAFSEIMCESPTEACQLGECKNCPDTTELYLWHFIKIT